MSNNSSYVKISNSRNKSNKQRKKEKAKTKKQLLATNSLKNGINILNNMINESSHALVVNRISDKVVVAEVNPTSNYLLPINESRRSLDFSKINIKKHVENNNEELDDMLAICAAKPKLYLCNTKNINTHTLGFNYEQIIKKHYENLGYHVKTTAVVHDFGVDLLAIKDTTIIAIQCKYWSDCVGVEAVQQVFSGMYYYEANKSLVVTNHGFTSNARLLAKKLRVELEIISGLL